MRVRGAWLRLKRVNSNAASSITGEEAVLYCRRIHGREHNPRDRRWSVIRDVLVEI
jgi:hypothetical protein